MANVTMSTEEVYDELKNEGVELSTKYSYSHPIKTNNKAKQISLGRIWFNSILPEDFRFINESINKNQLSSIIKEISRKYEPRDTSKYVRNIQKHANKLATIDPRTFQSELFIPSQEWKEKKEVFLKKAPSLNYEDFKKERKKLIDLLYNEMEEQNIPFLESLNSKSSGKMSKDTWEQLQVSKGMTPDIENNIKVINKGISDGYDIQEYYDAAAEARMGFFVKGTAVQNPGYLARKVTMSNANIKLDPVDCKSKHYLEIYSDSNNADQFIGRYRLVNNKLELIEEPIINETIKVRSPMYCKSKKGICSVCYGKLAESVNTNNIGILAAGAVNMIAVNVFMKMRHQSEKIKYMNVDFIDIINQSTVKLEELNFILDVQKTEIFAKDDIVIEIDKNEYDSSTLTEYHDKYVLPGLLTIRYGNEEPSYYSLPFNFDINLNKPSQLITKGRFLIFKYEKGEKLISQKQYIKGVNPAIITKLLDGTTKYVKDPRILLELISEELSGMDSVHLELVVSNMCRNIDDNKIPARLNNYKNFEIIGCKKLPFIDSWLSAMAFEDIQKSILTGLVSEEESTFNDLEKLLIKDNYKLEE